MADHFSRCSSRMVENAVGVVPTASRPRFDQPLLDVRLRQGCTLIRADIRATRSACPSVRTRRSPNEIGIAASTKVVVSGPGVRVAFVTASSLTLPARAFPRTAVRGHERDMNPPFRQIDQHIRRGWCKR